MNIERQCLTYLLKLWSSLCRQAMVRELGDSKQMTSNHTSEYCLKPNDLVN